MPAVVVLTTVPNSKEAAKLARLLVARRLAACVSIQNKIQSLYRWKGRLQNTSESLLLIKTPKNRYLKLETFLKKNHPYDVPEILALPVTGGFKPYLKWLEE